MLRRAAQRLVHLPQAAQQRQAAYAKVADDYSLVLQNPQKELSDHVPTPDKEIGLCAGVPLETFKRKVRVRK